MSASARSSSVIEPVPPLQVSTAEVSAVLPATESKEDPRIRGALAARPDTADEAAVVSAECEVEVIPAEEKGQ